MKKTTYTKKSNTDKNKKIEKRKKDIEKLKNEELELFREFGINARLLIAFKLLTINLSKEYSPFIKRKNSSILHLILYAFNTLIQASLVEQSIFVK